MISITSTPWGYADGKQACIFTLANASGAFVKLTNYGATLVSAWVPDREGVLGNVVLGYSKLEDYLPDKNYLGATIGRYANRIGWATFILDGISYSLDNNDNGNSNHGGNNGFNTKVFGYEVQEDGVRFSLLSHDGEGGFPGNLRLTVTYQWTEANELLISYHAVTDRPTPVNITNHAYFNLSAEKASIFDHQLRVLSDQVIEAASDHVPTGFIKPAGDLNFHQNKISEKLTHTDDGIMGLNVCYVLNKHGEDDSLACILSDPDSGRSLEVRTSYPGLILYTGDYLTGPTHLPFYGLCLECQFFPDSPNHPAFPSTVLRPGEVYNHSILFKFSSPQK